jgi:ribosomal protein S18 acetylase RimI-like enzyme
MTTIDFVGTSDLTDLASLYEELGVVTSDLRKMAENFEWIYANSDYFLLGARDKNNKLIGSLLGIICRDIAGECRPFMVLENMIVTVNCRGKGIGRKLVQEAEAIARKRDCYYIMLVSRAQRKDAHRFYESLGYNIGVVQGFKKYLC